MLCSILFAARVPAGGGILAVRGMARCSTVDRVSNHAKQLGSEGRIHCVGGKSFSYADLASRAEVLAGEIAPLLRRSSTRDSRQPRIAFCLPPNFSYLVAQYCTWMNSAIAVPLHPGHPQPEIEYIVQDSAPQAILCTSETKHLLEPIATQKAVPLVVLSSPDGSMQSVSNDSGEDGGALPEGDGAMLIYTSGTTGKPKGVVWTSGMIEFQYSTLSTAWGWQQGDRIINFLPLHHVHGVNNVVGCAVWNGAHLDMFEKFDVEAIWARICSETDAPTVFMAVPTIYARMIAEFHKSPTEKRRAAAAKLRLYVSGSAALQGTYFRQWEEITGQKILERYGMSEVGMALSNFYKGERREGWVGKPFPEVLSKVFDPDAGVTAPGTGPAVGELLLSGPGVFREYLNKPEATAESFDEEGYFKTGDIVERDADGWFRVLGRRSVDIIKSAGYKLSALEIEREMLEHPEIAQIAVVGIPDEEFGQLVGALVVLKDTNAELDVPKLRKWCKERLAAYKVPKVVKVAESIPRNAMGKIEKKKVVLLF